MNEGSSYRADVAGLRAVAVVAVILGHTGVPHLTGGYVGVDVFFVISGYLITSSIVTAVRAGRFSLSAFYERRIRRIAPAFFAMTTISLVAAWFLMPPLGFARFGQSLMATSTFGSNVLFWRQEGYFDAAATMKPMLHTWTLSVEEQYYLVVPVVLMGVAHSRGRIPRWLLGLFLGSLVACVVTTAELPRAAFYLMPGRGWEFLMGGVLAVDWIPTPASSWWREASSALGLVMIGWAITTFSRDTAFPGIAAVVPCAGTAMILHAHGGPRRLPTIAERLLGVRPIAFLGTLSYSLYLWHWPALVFTKHWVAEPGPRTLAVVLGGAIAVAIVSWRYVELPFRRPPKWWTTGRVWRGFAIATVVTFTAGLSTVLTAGWPVRVSAQVLAFDRAADDFNHDRPRCHGNDQRPISFEDQCAYGEPSVDPTIAIWGDSMAAELAVALGHEVAASRRAMLSISYTACPPTLGLGFPSRPRCADHDREMFDHLAASKQITKVILVADYERYHARLGSRFLDGFAALVTALARAGKHVYLVYPVPTPTSDVPSLLARLAMRGSDLRGAEIDRIAHDAKNREIIATLDKLVRADHVDAVHLDDLLCDAFRCRVYADGKVLYYDDHHLSVTGATLTMPAFRMVIEGP